MATKGRASVQLQGWEDPDLQSAVGDAQGFRGAPQAFGIDAYQGAFTGVLMAFVLVVGARFIVRDFQVRGWREALIRPAFSTFILYLVAGSVALGALVRLRTA